MKDLRWIVLVSASCAWLAGCQRTDPERAARIEEIARVDGFVLDALTEQPLRGVRVRARDVSGETRTDSRGRFSLPVPVGDHMLLLAREGYLEGERASVHVGREPATSVEARIFPAEPSDEVVAAYFARQPVRRHAHPAHERPSATGEPEGDLGRATAPLVALPDTIRVWRASGTPLQPTSANRFADQSCDPSANVIELPREEYVKGVVPHEWIPSWHPESLRAGAIAARTYAVRWALAGGRWDCADVDDGTVTQVYRDDRSMAANAAVDATAGMVVTRDGSVISTEYSAENSDPTAQGVDEPTCTGTERFGHGRGMCQWGSHRWASSICANPPCDFAAFGDSPKDHLWIVNHYYPGSLVEGSAPPAPCAVIGPEGGVLEETGPCFARFGPSTYWRSVTDAGSGGSLLWTNAFQASAPSNWARWSIVVATPSRFMVSVYVDATWGVFGGARYVVTHAGGESAVVVDQGASDGWVELGTFDFDREGAVRLEDNYATAVPADQHIVADAVRLLPESPGPLGDAGGVDAGSGDASAPGSSARLAGDRPAEPSRRMVVGCGVVGGGGGAGTVASARGPAAPPLTLLAACLGIAARRVRRRRSR